MINEEEMKKQGYKLVGATMHDDCRKAIENLFIRTETRKEDLVIVEQEAGKPGHRYVFYIKE